MTTKEKHQRWFNLAYLGLRKQGRKSAITKKNMFGSVSKICRYRTKCNGQVLKCAIGQIMTEDEYRPYLEENTILDLCLRSRKVKTLDGLPVTRKDVDFLSELQGLHDSLFPSKKGVKGFVEEFDWRAKELAKKMLVQMPDLTSSIIHDTVKEKP